MANQTLGILVLSFPIGPIGHIGPILLLLLLDTPFDASIKFAACV